MLDLEGRATASSRLPPGHGRGCGWPIGCRTSSTRSATTSTSGTPTTTTLTTPARAPRSLTGPRLRRNRRIRAPRQVLSRAIARVRRYDVTARVRRGCGPGPRSHSSWVAGQEPPARPIRHVWEAPVVWERTSVGLDVHARSVSAAAIDGVTGELIRQRLVPDPQVVIDWVHAPAGAGRGDLRGRPDRVRPGPGADRGRDPLRGRGAVEDQRARRGSGQDRRPGRGAAGPAAAPGRDRRRCGCPPWRRRPPGIWCAPARTSAGT